MSDSISSSTVPTLAQSFLGQPIEICIVTPNLRETLSGLVRLGIGPFKVFHFSPETVTEQRIHSQPAEFEIDVAFTTQGKHEMIWEVMQPVHGKTVMQEFLDHTNGRGGIHHISFDCDEHAQEPERAARGRWVGEAARAEAKRRRLEFERRGFAVAQSGVWHGKQGTCEFQFFETEDAVGTCFETYVFSDDWEDPDEGMGMEVFPPKERSL